MNRYRVQPGSKVALKDWSPDDVDGHDETDAKDRLEGLNKRLEELQEVLFAQAKHKMLVVLQAMDTGGKDGVIRRVFDGVNPLGVKVASFKKPTPEELAHDYLWRVHRHTPASGELVIFNRSHYEDVLVVRVHELAPKEQWQKRYEQITHFEKLLAEEGTTIIKFFLHISKEEQKERLQARLDDPDKRWKFAVGDLDARDLWDSYMAAFEEALSKTSTDSAPWYIVPANRKWFRDLVVSEVLVETLESLGLEYPEPTEDLDNVTIK